MKLQDKSRTQEFWDTEHDEWVGGAPDPYWTSHPLLNSYVNLQIAGGINRRTRSWLAEDIFQDLAPLPCVASVACGAGAADRQALVTGLAYQVHVYYFSQNSLQSAGHLAAADGMADRIVYRQYDFNSEPMPADDRQYPLIIIFGGLHHAERLEYVLQEIRARLAPGGVLFFNEYIGPNRFQYEKSHLDILNSKIRSIPEKYRHTSAFTPVDEQMLEKTDPSEAVRSGEIMRSVEEYFHVLDRRDYGGGLLFPLWSDVLIRERLSLPAQVERTSVLQNLLAEEEELTAAGVLPSLFTQCLVCRPEDAGKLEFIADRARRDSRVESPSAVLESLDIGELPWSIPEPGSAGPGARADARLGLRRVIRGIARRILRR